MQALKVSCIWPPPQLSLLVFSVTLTQVGPGEGRFMQGSSWWKEVQHWRESSCGWPSSHFGNAEHPGMAWDKRWYPRDQRCWSFWGIALAFFHPILSHLTWSGWARSARSLAVATVAGDWWISIYPRSIWQLLAFAVWVKPSLRNGQTQSNPFKYIQIPFRSIYIGAWTSSCFMVKSHLCLLNPHFSWQSKPSILWGMMTLNN